MPSSKSRVGLLTGTFDPVHLGHVAMARAAMTACELDEVWLLVNPDPGHKRGVNALVDRLAMVRLAVDAEPGLREGEPGDHGVRHHTMREFAQLMTRHPEREFVFIVGADVLEGLAAWEDAAVVAEQASFAAVRRPGQADLAIDPNLRVQWFEMGEYAEASSGRVRRALAAGAAADLDPAVLEYVRAQGLYKA